MRTRLTLIMLGLWVGLAAFYASQWATWAQQNPIILVTAVLLDPDDGQEFHICD